MAQRGRYNLYDDECPLYVWLILKQASATKRFHHGGTEDTEGRESRKDQGYAQMVLDRAENKPGTFSGPMELAGARLCARPS